jgi:signal transduction histidine kinase
MFRIRKDGTILDYKRPKKFAAEGADLVDKNVFELWSSHLTEPFRHSLAKALGSDEEQTFDLQLPIQGQLCHFEAQVVASGEAEVLAIVRDVSERKRLEQEILEISNREQRRIGYDLHDGLGQYLAGVAFKAKLLEDSLHSEKSPHLAEAQEVVRLVNNAIGQTRRLAQGCDPIAIAANDLGSALQRLADDTQKLFNVTCRTKCDPSMQTVDKLWASHLYRIAQEAISNAIKHGQARRIELELAVQSDQLCLTIRDDGKGFGPLGKADSGMGLRIIQYRAQSIGGTALIQSQPNHGAEVRCIVPLRLPEGSGEASSLHSNG